MNPYDHLLVAFKKSAEFISIKSGDSSELAPRLPCKGKSVRNRGVSQTMPFLVIPRSLLRGGFIPSVTKGSGAPGNYAGPSRGPAPERRRPPPATAAVFDAATALDTALDLVDPQPPLVALLVRHGLLQREILPQIEINSAIHSEASSMIRVLLSAPLCLHVRLSSRFTC
jgi:hypothetical protein